MSQTLTSREMPVYVGQRDIADLGRSGRSHIPVAVHGFWSVDSISIYLERKVEWMSSRSATPFAEHPAKWVVTMSHSAGGRDTASVPDDCEAECFYAMGLIAAAQHARTLLSRSAELEVAYQDHQAALEARRAHEAAEKADKVARDPALGTDAATSLVVMSTARVTRNADYDLLAFVRGSDDTHRFTFSRGRDGKVRISHQGRQVSRAAAIEALATYSTRTVAC